MSRRSGRATEHRVVAALGEPGAGIRGDREREAAVLQPALERIDRQLHDLREVVLAQRLEHHDVVETVEELGPERLPQ